MIVVIKFIAPAMEAAPAKCKLNIAKSTLKSACPKIPDSGGYNVQPVPTPDSTIPDINKRKSRG